MEVTPRKLTVYEIEYIKSFQEFIGILPKYFNEKREMFTGDLDQFKQEILRFSNYPFAQKMNKALKQMNDEVETIQKAKELPSADKHILSYTKTIENAFLTKNFGNNIPAITNNLKIALDQTNTKSKKPKQELEKYTNPYQVQDPLFFQTKDFIRSFYRQDMIEISKIDVEGKYTYLELPYTDTNFQYMVYFIQKLKDSGEPFELTVSENDKLVKYENRSNANFDELMGLVDRFLSSNERALLPDIIRGINEFPKLKQANERTKRQMVVYRGLAEKEDEPTYDPNIEKKQRYISTSLDRDVALRFALSLGHLDHISSARSDGIILTYEVEPDGVFLNTSIFGGKYSENEIIIDSQKAQLIDQEEIDREEYTSNDYDSNDDETW